MWAQPGSDGIVRVGVTHVPCSYLGDVVFVELPPPGTDVRAGEPVGLVESSVAVCEIVSPVSGIVEDVNPAVAKAPETITADPFEGGWLLAIRSSDPAELSDLLDSEEYNRYFPDE